MTKKLSSLSIFFPAFNEEENIENTITDAIANAKKLTKKFEIIVVNDGSTDNTAEVVKRISSKNKNIRLVSHDKNRGYGAAVKTGIKSCKYDWIFFTDSDGQFKLNELKKFVDNRDKADLIIGYRKKRMDPFHRIFIAKVLLKIWNRVLFGLKLKDVDCAYKLFPKKIIKGINLETESAITVTELLVKAKQKGHTILELPVTHYARKHGVQTGGNPKVILRAAKESFYLYRQTSRSHRLSAAVLIIALTLFALFLRLYKIDATLNFHHDEGRDVLIMKKMIDERKPILLGPQTSMGGMYLGALYYYLLAPALLIANFNPIGPAIFIAFTGAATVWLLYVMTKKWFGKKTALISSLLYAIMPLTVLFTRNSWNPNLAPLISLLAYYCVDKIITEKHSRKSYLYYLLTGLFMGVLLQLHYVTLLFIAWAGVVIAIKKRITPRVLIKGTLIIILGLVIALSPFILFELRHGFVNIRGTIDFINKGDNDNFRLIAPIGFYFYKINFTLNRFLGSLFGRAAVNAVDTLTPWITNISAFIISISVFFIKKADKLRGYLLYSLIMSSLIITSFYQGNVYTHYLGFLFPIIYIYASFLVTHAKKIFQILVALLLFLSVSYSFSSLIDYLTNSTDSNHQTEKSSVVAQEILSRADGSHYNVIAAHDTTRDATYLYYLSLSDNPPSNELQEQVFIICEDRECTDDDANNPWLFRKGASHPALDDNLGHPFYNEFTNSVEIINMNHIIYGVYLMETNIQK